MKVEISALFGMDYSSDMVEDLEIGSGVFIQNIRSNKQMLKIFQDVKDNDERNFQNLIYREEIEHTFRPYTHRFFISLESDYFRSDEVELAKQFLIRAIILSRILKPLPIPIHPTTIISEDGVSRAEIYVGFYSNAYVSESSFNDTITQVNAQRMRDLWQPYLRFYDRFEEYRSLHRAIKMVNDADHIAPAHVRHVVMHAALETLICQPQNNRNQVVNRLPQLTSVSKDEAADIYDFCIDVKHDAAPAFKFSQDVHSLDPRDEKRKKAARNLDASVREILIRAIEDDEFASKIENKIVLSKEYPV